MDPGTMGCGLRARGCRLLAFGLHLLTLSARCPLAANAAHHEHRHEPHVCTVKAECLSTGTMISDLCIKVLFILPLSTVVIIYLKRGLSHLLGSTALSKSVLKA